MSGIVGRISTLRPRTRVAVRMARAAIAEPRILMIEVPLVARHDCLTATRASRLTTVDNTRDSSPQPAMRRPVYGLVVKPLRLIAASRAAETLAPVLCSNGRLHSSQFKRTSAFRHRLGWQRPHQLRRGMAKGRGGAACWWCVDTPRHRFAPRLALHDGGGTGGAASSSRNWSSTGHPARFPRVFFEAQIGAPRLKWKPGAAGLRLQSPSEPPHGHLRRGVEPRGGSLS